MSLLGREYATSDFLHGEISRPVYHRGSGPTVILMHELPGLAEPTVRLAEELVGAGYSVLLPHLFGGIHDQPHNHTVASLETDVLSVANLTLLCVQREFAMLRGGKSAPIADWLRALAKAASERQGGAPIGVIGMCLTGGYVLAMMIDPWVIAPVTSQPAIPLPKGLAVERKSSEVSVSDDELEAAATRASTDGITLLAFRFGGDSLCPAARFARLEHAFGGQLEAHVYPTPNPAHRLADDAHSVLTYEFESADPKDLDHPSRQARRRLLQFLSEKLGGSSAQTVL